jgi:hypothetical protein
MAIDLQGMLTGGAGQQINPSLSVQQQQLALGANASNMMQGGMRSMQGQPPQGAQAAQLQKLMGNLDLNKTEDLGKLAEIMQMTGNTAGAGKIAAQLEARKRETNKRDGLIGQAKRLGLTETLDGLKSGMDLDVATKQVLEAEERNIVSSQGRNGRAEVARNRNAGEEVVKAILKGDFDNLSDTLFMARINGEKAELKTFKQVVEGTEVIKPFRINEGGKVFDSTTKKWVNPSDLGLLQAPQVTKQLTEANTYAQALTEGAAKNFLELNERARSAQEILRTNAESTALLDREGKIKTGFGAEFRLNVSRVAKELNLVPESMDNIAATEQYLILRAEQLMKIMPAFGAGSGLSDSDREVASQIALRDVSMDEVALRNLLRLEEKYARALITDNNKALERAVKIGKDGLSPDLAESYYIELPTREGYRPTAAARKYLPDPRD